MYIGLHVCSTPTVEGLGVAAGCPLPHLTYVTSIAYTVLLSYTHGSQA